MVESVVSLFSLAFFSERNKMDFVLRFCYGIAAFQTTKQKSRGNLIIWSLNQFRTVTICDRYTNLTAKQTERVLLNETTRSATIKMLWRHFILNISRRQLDVSWIGYFSEEKYCEFCVNKIFRLKSFLFLHNGQF